MPTGEITPRMTRRPPRRPVSDARIDEVLPKGRPSMDLTEIEEGIKRCARKLLEMADDHQDLAIRAGNAKADWMDHLANVLVRIIHSDTKQGSADTREAIARCEIDPVTGRTGKQLYRDYKTLTEAVEAQKNAMYAVQVTMSGFQTLANNFRSGL